MTQRRAAIYVRISADPEGRQLGVQRQEQDCRALAERLGLTVMQVFSDNDVSASRRSRKPRPGYAAMMEAVRAGQVSAIVAYSSSRLTRRPRELEDLIELADPERGRGLQVHTVTGSVDLSTSAGRTVAGILAAIDAGEADTISERARRERQQRRERGRLNGGGYRSFGFERDGTTPRPAEQEMIRRACDDVLAGRTLAGIARDWAKVCPPPTWRAPLVVRWSTSTVRDVLTSRRLIGQLPSGHPAADQAGFVDEATWAGVVAILSDPSRHRARVNMRLLTGIAFCGLCGATVHGGMNAQGGATYRCSALRHLDRKAVDIDTYVRDVLLKFLATNRVSASPGPNTSALAGRAAGIRARLAELEESASDPDGPSPKMLAAAERKLTAELELVEAELAASAGTSALAGLPTDQAELAELWEGADVERRRTILRAAPVRITLLSPGRGAHIFRPETVQIIRKDA